MSRRRGKPHTRPSSLASHAARPADASTGVIAAVVASAARGCCAFCGCVGMKPTYGRVSRYGLVAFASSLDQIGPFARTLEDLLLAMEVIAEAQHKGEIRSDIPKEHLALIILGTLRLMIKRWRLSGYAFDLRQESRQVWHSLKTLIGIEAREQGNNNNSRHKDGAHQAC